MRSCAPVRSPSGIVTVTRAKPAWRCGLVAEGLQLLLELRAPPVPAQLADQELHPVALLVLEVAQAMEDAEHRFRDLQDLARGEEIEQLAGRSGHGRRAAARDHMEPALAV